MSTIPQSELRNNVGEILERVRDGETIEISSGREIAAILVPPSVSPFERLLWSGAVRVASEAPVDFRRVPRIKSDVPTTQILAELRGDK